MEEEEAGCKKELAEHFFRHSYAKMVAILVRYFGLQEVEMAEDIVQDTLVEAMEKWSVQSIPNNPEGWLMSVAKKKTINFLKRKQTFESKVRSTIQFKALFEANGQAVERDSTLRMIFTCCHPSLPVEAQIALALKTLCGLSVSEIANALLTSESTINKRLYRAKQKFRDGSITFAIPDPRNLDQRLAAVFTTLYLLFNEGYYSSHHEKVIRIDLCFEAIRLVKEVLEFYPNSHPAKALLALMFLSVARFESRIDEQGALVILAEQDRELWDKALIAEGMDYLHQSTEGNEISAYHLQAGIAAEHCLATNFASTNWASIYRQYSMLEQLQPNVFFTFNKAIAKFFGINQEEALMDLLALKKEQALQSNSQFYASLGMLHAEMGLAQEALSYFQKALSFSKSTQEKALIEQRINQ
ncbi:MAG: sigma-70 family RNA polymerase sigma factor [Bacteroidota bacterium]